MAEITEFNIGQGETFKILTSLENIDTDSYLDITNYTFTGQVRENFSTDEVAATFTITKINPNHLGALEYQGELFLQTKKVSSAKKNLAKLKKLCGENCEEYLDLKQAIGNR